MIASIFPPTARFRYRRESNVELLAPSLLRCANRARRSFASASVPQLFSAVGRRKRSRLTQASRRMERRRKRIVMCGIGWGGQTDPRCFQRWMRDRRGYPARLYPTHAQPAQSVLTMLQRIAVTRGMRTCGSGKIEPAELKRKYDDQRQGNRPCGYRSSCPTTYTQGALPARKTNPQHPVI